MKRPSGYRIQFFEGGIWHNVTHPNQNKKVVFRLLDQLGEGYRVQNVYTGQEATRP